MDALSDVLRAVRLTGAIFFDVRASAPWVAETPPGEKVVRTIFPDAGHLIPYHVITRGGCWAGAVGDTPLHLETGDVIVFPQGDAHVLSSAAGMRAAPNMSIYRPPADGHLPFVMSMGEGPDPAHIVCGFLGCDARPFNPLLAALPRVLRVSGRAGGVIGGFIELAVAESTARKPGGAAVLGRLSELMFVDVVRRYIETLPADRADWLAGLRDPFIGRAIGALHREPARAWTLADLAHEVGLSRSVLADRFTSFVGQPPMQYLTNWRMQLAASALVTGTDTIAAIAERVGYESEASFGRAFKKIVGRAPGEWRRHRDANGEPA